MLSEEATKKFEQIYDLLDVAKMASKELAQGFQLGYNGYNGQSFSEWLNSNEYLIYTLATLIENQVGATMEYMDQHPISQKSEDQQRGGT